ncbi:hypothetical protein KW790_02790 [Candidatus Parcubacteria bacterium]|nr:hypothetical protein [Candidatus Parcubacteria bacterium]
MSHAGVLHADDVESRVDNVEFRNIPVGSSGQNRLIAYFCQSVPEVLEKIASGDGQELPEGEVEVLGLEALDVEPGYYSVFGRFSSNGHNTFSVTKAEKTRLSQYVPAF